MNRTTIEEQLIRHEGMRLKPYADAAGKLTIGVGRNLSDNGISRAEAKALLRADIARVEAELSRHCPWWLQMTENRQNALADMCFNLGWPRLSKFTHFLRTMEHEEYLTAAWHMLDSKWAKQVGKRAETLASMVRRG